MYQAATCVAVRSSQPVCSRSAGTPRYVPRARWGEPRHSPHIQSDKPEAGDLCLDLRCLPGVEIVQRSRQVIPYRERLRGVEGLLAREVYPVQCAHVSCGFCPLQMVAYTVPG